MEEVDEGNGWITTYSDTITLLLTFFILLYSMSVIDNEKLKQVSGALTSQLTGNPVLMENVDENTEGVQPEIPNLDVYDELVKKVNSVLVANSLQDVVKIRQEPNGIVLQLGEAILFDPGKAELKEGSRDILEVIAQVIPQIDNNVVIEGHTDNVPISSGRYESNWELSTSRAINVLKFFIEEKQINPTKFSATGYGEYRPLVENTTDENKSTNRRVDILIVQQKEKEAVMNE